MALWMPAHAPNASIVRIIHCTYFLFGPITKIVTSYFDRPINMKYKYEERLLMHTQYSRTLVIRQFHRCKKDSDRLGAIRDLKVDP